MLTPSPLCSSRRSHPARLFKKPVDVTGQIFVVTEGRENIKMGGMDVCNS
jgi:hypothetical protein